MYESPIELVYKETFPTMIKQQEDLIIRGCLDVGVCIDKEELIKALQYDRNQYQKGYNDGKPKKGKWIEEGDQDYPCVCSICRTPQEIKAKFLFSYCPNCGADMRGDKDECIN